MLLKYYLDQGVSKVELSRRFGVNRRTIHYWIETDQLDRDLSAGPRGYATCPPVAYKLDPCKGIIDALREVFPKLSAKRLFDEVRAGATWAAIAACWTMCVRRGRVSRSRRWRASMAKRDNHHKSSRLHYETQDFKRNQRGFRQG